MRYVSQVNVPQVQNLAAAVALYYEKNELGTDDVMRIFGCSRSTAGKLKNRAREQMRLDAVPSWNQMMVNTEAGYKSWGLDIDKMKQSLAQLKRLGLAASSVGCADTFPRGEG